MKELINQTTVIEMGFTKTMIKKLLPAPIEKANPHNKAIPIKLFEKDTVEKVMQTEEYKTEYEKAQKQKTAALKAVKTKEETLLQEMSEIIKSIKIQVIPEERLITRAIADYNAHQQEKSEKSGEPYFTKVKAEDLTEETLNRLIVNYIRHNLTTYDRNLLILNGKTGKQKGYIDYKEAILQQIALAYPKYKEECQRQIERSARQ